MSLTRRALAAGIGGAVVAAGLGATGIATAREDRGRSGRRPQTRTIRYQGSAGAVTPLELAAGLGYLEDVRLEWIGNSTSGPQDIQATVTGDTDIGGAFNGAIIRLVAAGAPITSLYSYYGVDAKVWSGYYVREDSPVRTVRDLADRTVGANTLGGQADDVLRMRLRSAGLPADRARSAQIVVVPPVSAEQALRSGQLDVAVLGGILRDAALERGGIRPVFNDYQVLGAFSCGCQVMRDGFVHDNPDTVRAVVGAVARALAWSQRRPAPQVIDRFRRILKDRKRAEDAAALQFWKGYGVAGRGGVIAARELSVWRDRLVDDGIVDRRDAPLDRLYTNRFNPYSGAA
ncbi:ABC transporter substrate-binding protein [Streptomyces sp. NPDC017993]|uniref:ABC transporter substrate-binding protein n=1 Tax=Streptomyces sp. NPDC017993 TaxID=3365027 RepID=UPI0037AFC156